MEKQQQSRPSLVGCKSGQLPWALHFVGPCGARSALHLAMLQPPAPQLCLGPTQAELPRAHTLLRSSLGTTFGIVSTLDSNQYLQQWEVLLHQDNSLSGHVYTVVAVCSYGAIPTHVQPPFSC